MSTSSWPQYTWYIYLRLAFHLAATGQPHTNTCPLTSSVKGRLLDNYSMSTGPSLSLCNKQSRGNDHYLFHIPPVASQAVTLQNRRGRCAITLFPVHQHHTRCPCVLPASPQILTVRAKILVIRSALIQGDFMRDQHILHSDAPSVWQSSECGRCKGSTRHLHLPKTDNGCKLGRLWGAGRFPELSAKLMWV